MKTWGKLFSQSLKQVRGKSQHTKASAGQLDLQAWVPSQAVLADK